jgi:hypothetical protein
MPRAQAHLEKALLFLILVNIGSKRLDYWLIQLINY